MKLTEQEMQTLRSMTLDILQGERCSLVISENGDDKILLLAKTLFSEEVSGHFLSTWIGEEEYDKIGYWFDQERIDKVIIEVARELLLEVRIRS